MGEAEKDRVGLAGKLRAGEGLSVRPDQGERAAEAVRGNELSPGGGFAGGPKE